VREIRTLTCDMAGAGNQLTARLMRHHPAPREAPTHRLGSRSDGASPRRFQATCGSSQLGKHRKNQVEALSAGVVASLQEKAIRQVRLHCRRMPISLDVLVRSWYAGFLCINTHGTTLLRVSLRYDAFPRPSRQLAHLGKAHVSAKATFVLAHTNARANGPILDIEAAELRAAHVLFRASPKFLQVR
jgi:hypothetical protein